MAEPIGAEGASAEGTAAQGTAAQGTAAQGTAAQGTSAEGAAYAWALRVSVVSLAALAIVGGTAAGLIRGSGGLWGALAAVGIAALSGLVTQVAMIVGSRRDPVTFVGIVAGSWLVKMIVIVAAVLVLGRFDSVDRGTFGTVLLLGVGATLAVDMFAVRRARIPYTG